MKKCNFILVLIFMAMGLHPVFCQWNPLGKPINGRIALEKLGSSVSLSADGYTLAVGAPGDKTVATTAGSCKAYRQQGGSWVLITPEITGEKIGDRFGHSVSLSSDGNTLAIGAPNLEGVKTKKGYVKIFQVISGVWVQLGNTIFSREGGDLFGYSVSLSSDGTIVAIGAPYNDVNSRKFDGGIVRVYRLRNLVWTQVGTDIQCKSAADRFGTSVSLAGNGQSLVIGAPWNDANGSNSGQVTAFQWNGGNWEQMGQDIYGDAVEDWFGWSVAISKDGHTLVAGAFKNDAGGSNAGHARVYQFRNNSWIQAGQDIHGEGPGDQFGYSVSINAMGNIVAIGGPLNAGTGLHEGHVKVLKIRNGAWTLIDSELFGRNAGDWYGSAVALNDAGNIVAGGASENASGGQVLVFENKKLLATEPVSPSPQISGIYPNPTSEQVYLRLDNNPPATLSITNTSGAELLTKSLPGNAGTLRLDIGTFAPGLYVITIQTPTERIHRLIQKI